MQGGIERIKPLHPFVFALMNGVYVYLIQEDVRRKLRAGLGATEREWALAGLGLHQ